MKGRTLLIILVLTSLLATSFASVGPAQAADTIELVDQSNNASHGTFSLRYAGLIGQSFTPTLPVLDMVELWTEDYTWGNGYGIELYVNIRQTTIDGIILGTSNLLQLPDNFSGVTRFTFPSLVSLTPGKLYVIELVVVSGQDSKYNWGIRYWSATGSKSPYPGGTSIIQGVENPNVDLWFREGLASKSPQSSAHCKHGLWAYLSRPDGSNFKNQGDCIQYVNTEE